jgi:hypothetical protein
MQIFCLQGRGTLSLLLLCIMFTCGSNGNNRIQTISIHNYFMNTSGILDISCSLLTLSSCSNIAFFSCFSCSSYATKDSEFPKYHTAKTLRAIYSYKHTTFSFCIVSTRWRAVFLLQVDCIRRALSSRRRCILWTDLCPNFPILLAAFLRFSTIFRDIRDLDIF